MCCGFANFQQPRNAITQAIIDTNWRSYGLEQPKSGLPVAPLGKLSIPSRIGASAAAIQHDGARVAVQHLAWHAAECQEGVAVRLDQGLNPLVGDELDKGGAAPS